MTYSKCKVCGNDTFEFLAHFELLKCKSCGFLFYKHRLNETDVRELYDKLYNKQDDYSHFKQQAESLRKGDQPQLGYNKLKVLKTILAKDCKNFIEIGAGVGVVGNYLQNKKKGYQGIELDSEAANLANEVGVNVKNVSFHQLAAFENQDAVLAFEVIEHIDDLKLCFELIRGSLRPEGYLGFTVPNFDRFYNLDTNTQQKKLGQTGPPVHINFFTKESTEKILRQFGFKPLYLRVRPFPDLHWHKRSTYQKLWRSIKGKYHGSTIICIAQKIN